LVLLLLLLLLLLLQPLLPVHVRARLCHRVAAVLPTIGWVGLRLVHCNLLQRAAIATDNVHSSRLELRRQRL
jgi:hypothetical protein